MSMFKYECDEVKKIIDEVSPNYPQLTTFEKEWLYFHKYGYIPGIPVNLEYQVVEGTGLQTINNAIPFNYKSAILKGSTKYRDIDTGDILDTFDETKNLELVSVQMPVLTTSNEDGTQTNILTVNEDVELHGVGDVQDTLDLMTGELTERFGEVVLNGSEEWSVNNSNNDGFYSCSTTTYVGVPNGNVICDKLPTTTSTKAEGIMIGISTGKIMVSFNRNKTGITSLAKFKEKLAQLQLKVFYELATPTIKTVGLTDKLSKSYDGTNRYESYSDTIPPIMFLEVPVVSKGNKTLLDIQNQD